MRSEISRVTRSKRAAMQAYDRLSGWYDFLASGSELPLARFGLERLALQPGGRALEIGCGTGQLLPGLASALGEHGALCGLDLSCGMLALARRRLQGSAPGARVSLAQADGTRLPYPEAAFDAVCMSFVLELFDTPEIPAVLAECRRALRPGGRICVVAMVRDERENFPLRVYEWFHSRLPALVDCRPIYLRPVLEQAGFKVKEITRRWMWGLPVEICIGENV